jgi:hypothetical protein
MYIPTDIREKKERRMFSANKQEVFPRHRLSAIQPAVRLRVLREGIFVGNVSRHMELFSDSSLSAKLFILPRGQPMRRCV